MILFIKHISIEGPGTIADFLEDNKIPYIIIDLSSGDRLPRLEKAFQSVISLGGPMNVYEEEKYPFLREEDTLLKRVVEEEVPFLGICLGAQLIAKATGAKVSKNPEKEIGWYKTVLNDYGLHDDLFKGFPEIFQVFQWHGDTFTIPEGGKRLAFSELCQNQVLKYGRNIYGIQFHVEITKDTIIQWADAYKGELESLKGIVSDKQKMLADYHALEKGYLKQSEQFYVNFFNVANLLKRKHYSFPQ
ncbi:MAG: type 1 glutamine amidotransferase [Candidatus Loosdrechtia sp.]|uniref:type 1 glutamine amidotransferase n=1 Tax=Candidatus Loosdrechtia sp. TaxID=3101272 RepID=UPI003A6C8E80|nr:MAG: type 1 glutamine amidotransferase [Candidatus Jettenia sp. AMX2]